MKALLADIRIFAKFLVEYLKSKVITLAFHFETFKNISVNVLMFKRGILQKKVWHTSMIGLSVFGVMTSGVVGSQTIVSSSFPGISADNPRFAQTYEPSLNDPVLNSLYDTRTTISQKPRSEIIEHEVKAGETLSSIASDFGISVETIRWANKLGGNDTILPGQTLKILPVSGVAHVVVSGDTLESVAKKYSTEAQGILDFPFNDVPDDFKLKIAQLLIVPDGVPPETKLPKVYRQEPKYLAQGPGSPTFTAPGGGNFIWPTKGILTQYFAWYHPGVDIADRSGPGIAAADGGVVIIASWPDNSGYGNRVVIEHGNGYRTLYAHLANIYINVGQTVSRGQIIGRMGTTGRSTGTHLHFEIRYKGIGVNPLAILK